MRYSYYEYELIDQMYDEQSTYQTIADECNKSFHDGKPVRTVNSIGYVIRKINEDPDVLDFDWWDERGLLD